MQAGSANYRLIYISIKNHQAITYPDSCFFFQQFWFSKPHVKLHLTERASSFLCALVQKPMCNLSSFPHISGVYSWEIFICCLEFTSSVVFQIGITFCVCLYYTMQSNIAPIIYCIFNLCFTLIIFHTCIEIL